MIKQLLSLLLLISFSVNLNSQTKVKWVYNLQGYVDSDITKLVVDSIGNVYAVGQYSFWTKTPDTKQKLDSKGNAGSFLLKISPEGKTIWALNFYGSRGNYMDCVSLMKDGNIVISGRVLNTEIDAPQMNSSASKFKITPGVFIAVYTPEGNVKWLNSFGTQHAAFTSVAADNSGNIYAAGFYREYFRMNEFQMPKPYQREAEMLFKFSPEGEIVWSKYIEHQSLEYNFSLKPIVKIGKNQGPVMAGVFRTKIKFSSSDSLTIHRKEDDRDIYFAAFSPEGEVNWTKQLGGYSTQYLGDFDISQDGRIYGCAGFYTEFVVKQSGISHSKNTQKDKSNNAVVLFTLSENGDLLDLNSFNQQIGGFTMQMNEMTILPDGRQWVSGNFSDTISYPRSDGSLAKIVGWPTNHNVYSGFWDEHGGLLDLWMPSHTNGWAVGRTVAANGTNGAMNIMSANDLTIYNVKGKDLKFNSHSNGRSATIIGFEIPVKQRENSYELAESCEPLQVLKSLKSFHLPKAKTTEEILQNSVAEELVLIDTIDKPSRSRGDIIPGCTVFPNPSSGSTTISIAGFTGQISLKIYASSGCLLYSQSLIIDTYDFSQNVDLSSLAAGTYYFVLDGKEFRRAFRIIKI
jgi:hypothetical protein